MAVTVTDTRTTFDDADDVAGWNQGDALSTVFAEAPFSIIETFNIANGQIFFTGGAVNLSNTLVYVWSNNFALQGAWDAVEPPNALMLGDGTDQVSFKMAGNNRKVFSHLDAGAGIQVDWDCLVLDGSQAAAMDTAGLTVEITGTGAFATLDLTNIVDIGADLTTLSKGLGGGVNVAVDIIRFGNDGLRITAGTTGDRGTFAEIVAEDQSSATGKAHGIIRQLSTGLYSLQGPLNFGIATTATDSFFEDTGRVISFEDRNISDNKYYIAVTGHVDATNLFSLSNSTVTTAGPLVKLNFNGGEVDTLLLDSNSFSGLGNPIIFSNLTDASGHTVTNNTFTGCGQIDPGDVTFTGNTIADTTNILGGMLLDVDGTDNISDISFISGGTGHAIEISLNTASLTTFDITGFTVSGYETTSDGSTGNTVFIVDNDLDGDVDINITDGTGTFSYERAAGYTGTVQIIASATLSLTGIQTDSEVNITNLDDTINFDKTLSSSEQISGIVTKVEIVDGGSGYSVGDDLTVVGGTGSAATFNVDTVDTGAVTSVSILTPGSYTANPPTPTTTTVVPDVGTGCTLRLTIAGTHDFVYSASGLGGTNIAIVVFHLNFKEVRIEQALSTESQSIPIQQSTDRVFNNP